MADPRRKSAFVSKNGVEIEMYVDGVGPAFVIIIPACDPFKPKPYWQELRSQFGDRLTTMVIDDAAHALFPEQPDMVAKAILPWLARYRAGGEHDRGS